ncbi:hypothetical protein Aspvir_010058 [Aspergillus viridinutans]|uniref:Uncharacterized protein n=1 Tax=Aspergillus viridinutans TaxID=75553 RepID=A0A9P3C4A7_ASPVI|nr:uncharacterized protein Aspvir_010058 [Aspergillus viridinutans]GIK05943.1 hypothetical protein Aspvir_010058 [Aspergillus viridinutans]
MPKKGGKGKKGKGKGGGGTAKKAPTVQEHITTGHQVEDVIKGEGEGETTESLAPGTAINVPSAAPPHVAASTGAEGTSTAETTENGDSSNEDVDELRNPGTAKRFSLAEHPGDAKGRGMPSSLPDRGEAESEMNENTLQGAVGKTQASKAGLVGLLDAGDGEGQAVLPDTVAKESQLTAPTTAPETTIPEATATEAAPPVPVVTDANAPVWEAPAETALPERLKEKETAAAEPTATSPSDSADLTGHPKRPYESSLFHKDEDHKPPKMAKVEDSEAAPAAAETKAADLQTEVPSKSTVQPLVVPGLGAESTDKPVSDAEIPQKVEPAEAVAPTTVPSAAQAAASTTSPLVPAAGAGGEADAEARQKQEAKESIQAFTGEGQGPAAKEPQQESEEKAKEKAQETAPVETTPETPTKAKPNVATAAAVAAMRGKSAASPAPATEGADKTEAEPKESQPETQPETQGQTRGEEAAAEETQQPETTDAKKSHEEAQTAVDKAQEAAKAEAAKADKRKSGFWSWIKRKVKGT